VIVAFRGASQTRRFRITPLVRWRAPQRSRLFEEVPRLLSTPREIDATLFPKLPPGFESFYSDLASKGVPLARTVAPGGFSQLLVPTTPRYFISAVKRSLDRVSARLLTFDSEEDFFRAYLTLNSSIAYLWWRVRDGGMTLSQETLMSIPIDRSLDPKRPAAKALALRRAIRSIERCDQVQLWA
jgi:hypothetical protein